MSYVIEQLIKQKNELIDRIDALTAERDELRDAKEVAWELNRVYEHRIAKEVEQNPQLRSESYDECLKGDYEFVKREYAHLIIEEKEVEDGRDG